MIDPQRLMAEPLPRVEQTLGWRDCILYALGLGVGLDPLDETDLPFVDERRLKVEPTMANVMGYPGFWMREPRFGLDYEKTVHGEHSIRLHRPLPAEAKVTGTSRITGLVDKGAAKGALIYVEREIEDAAGTLLATVRQTVFCRGDGGFGGSHGTVPDAPAATPDRTPDATIDMPTSPQGALIYRLSGDYNPLHFDPAAARRAGFPRPILHGLATFGVAGHGLVKALCGGRPERLLAMGGRFSAPVYPGELVRIDIWHGDPGRAAFSASVPERGAIVMSHGFAEIAA